MLVIRPEEPEDIPVIRAVHEAAFPGPEEARLVDALREAGRAWISLVAEKDQAVVGHVLFSPVTVEEAPSGLKSVGLAPLAVLPAYQNLGIGGELVRTGLEWCWNAGYDLVVVLGSPAYYRRFGFQRAGQFGLENEFGVDEEFMAIELRESALAGVKGLVKYAPEFSLVS